VDELEKVAKELEGKVVSIGYMSRYLKGKLAYPEPS
jgi:hypothetical protein